MNDNNTNQKFEQALSLLKLGWSVIPIGTNKKPMVDWEPFQSIIATEDQIKEWFKNPKTNIGVVTGRISNLIVVDIDPRHGGTEESFKDVQTAKSATGGGGWHYYFKNVDGIQNSVNIKQGIDIRGEGGYVVVPPSSHPSGKNYEWIKSPSDTEIASLPDFVKEWIAERDKYGRIVKAGWLKVADVV